MINPLTRAPLPREANMGSIQGTFNSLVNGSRALIATAGTAQQLTATPTETKLLMIQALFTNTKNIAVGDSTTKATIGSEKGIFLEPGATATLPISDVSQIWVDGQINTDGYTYQYYF